MFCKVITEKFTTDGGVERKCLEEMSGVGNKKKLLQKFFLFNSFDLP